MSTPPELVLVDASNDGAPVVPRAADQQSQGFASVKILVIFVIVVFAILMLFIVIYYYFIRGMQQRGNVHRTVPKSTSGSINDEARNIFSNPERQMAVDQSARASPSSNNSLDAKIMVTDTPISGGGVAGASGGGGVTEPPPLPPPPPQQLAPAPQPPASQPQQQQQSKQSKLNLHQSQQQQPPKSQLQQQQTAKSQLQQQQPVKLPVQQQQQQQETLAQAIKRTKSASSSKRVQSMVRTLESLKDTLNESKGKGR